MTATTEINKIISKENLVYSKTSLLLDNEMHYCPGCTHGVIHKVIAEVIDEMGIQDKTIGVSPVGCSVLAYNYLDIDWQQAAHGRRSAKLRPRLFAQADSCILSRGCSCKNC